MAEELATTFEDYDSLDEDELLEDPRPDTHVDLPDPDDPDSKTEGDTVAPPKPWKRLRPDSEPDEK